MTPRRPAPAGRAMPIAGALLRAALFLVLLPAAGSAPARAADPAALDIGPGPRVMSAEERALQADPATGAEHGVVLVDETVIDETAGTDTLTRYHMRAKIFSPEARGLADIELPIGVGKGALKRWWATVILPDGTVTDLPQKELREETEAQAGSDSYTTLKANLPGVVQGCVIDYGWYLYRSGFAGRQTVELQKEWPIKVLRLRWQPTSYYGNASYHLSRPDNVHIQVTRSARAILVDAHDLPAARAEPLMPPRANSFAMLTLYYRASNDPPKEYWTLEAKRLDRRITDACRDREIPGLAAEIGGAADAGLDQRLRAAYGWITRNLQSDGFRTIEQEEAATDATAKPRGTWVRPILDQHHANDWDLETLFVCVARALGAEAYIAFAADRTWHIFDTSLLTMSQFNKTLGWVRAPGDPDEKGAFVDDGLGLPYGEVAWWFTGVNAFVADPQNPRGVKVRPAGPDANLSETTTRLTYDASAGVAALRWSRTGRGQHGLAERLKLRRSAPAERKTWLNSACGASGSIEIDRAAAPHLDEPTADFQLECEGRLLGTNLTPEIGSYTFHILGPWIESLPSLPAGPRTQPVVLEFPRHDRNVIDIPSPPGFEPATDPMVFPVTSAFGDYRLTVMPNSDGYHVERNLTLAAIGIPPQEYEELRAFMTDVAKADRTRLKFVRRGTPP